MSFGSPSPPPLPPAPKPIPTPEDPAVEEARRKALVEARSKKSAASTLLTGGTGVTSQANTQTTTLLGGGT